MLIAMPAMNDERFSRAVIYVCAHSSEGAMGIVVNQPAGNIKFPDLLVQLEVIPAAERIELPARAEDVKVLKGGPVETGRGFVLHSADFFIENSTLPIDEGICLTATLDILKAIARGNGPASAILALGYAGWAPGQLENEIQQNGWLHCAADPELIFGTDTDAQIRKGAAQDRHRSRHAVERIRPRLARDPEKACPDLIRDGNRFSAFAKPAAAGERRSDMITRKNKLLFDRKRDPERLRLRKLNVVEAGCAQHIGDLCAREPLLQPRAEPVEGVGAHHIKRTVAVIRERP